MVRKANEKNPEGTTLTDELWNTLPATLRFQITAEVLHSRITSLKILQWMRESPEPVLLYIPLMKELGLSWNEIKNTPRVELEGLLCALAEYQQLHSLDGYDEDDINKMAKQNHAFVLNMLNT